MFNTIKRWFKQRNEGQTLESWFSVSWDDTYIYRNVSPPSGDAWNDKFKWADIERICFEATDYMYSDDLYFFTTERAESYIVPLEAKGGEALWHLVIEKKRFDAKLAIDAMTSVSGVFCYPKHNNPEQPNSLSNS